jgi:hypothetical protein
MTILTRAELLKQRPRRTKRITLPESIPELAGKVIIVQAMTARERANYERSLLNPKTGEPDMKRAMQARERMAIACVVDEDGNRMLTPADLEALNKIDVAVLALIATAAMELSTGSDDDYEEMVGNSEPTTGEDSACA